jgi:Uma2 family endonuclease
MEQVAQPVQATETTPTVAIAALPIHRRLFTADEFHTLARVGVLHEDDRLELIEGEIVEMSPIGSSHAGNVNRLIAVLTRAFGEKVVVSVQNPIRLDPQTEPQPDISVLRPRADFYTDSHPTAEDILLLIEVSESSVEYDRKVKVPLYAKAGILEVWLIVPETKVIEVYTNPAADGYRLIRRALPGESIALQALPDVNLPVNDILK